MNLVDEKNQIVTCAKCGGEEMTIRNKTKVYCASCGTFAKSLEPKLENEFMRL